MGISVWAVGGINDGRRVEGLSIVFVCSQSPFHFFNQSLTLRPSLLTPPTLHPHTRSHPPQPHASPRLSRSVLPPPPPPQTP